VNVKTIEQFINLNVDDFRDEVEHKIRKSFNADFPIVLYGAGNIGKDVLKRLRSIGVEVAGFLDDTPHKRNSTINGVIVLNQQDLYDKYRNNVNLVVCILNPNHNFSKTFNFFNANYSIKPISFYFLSWMYPDPFSDMHALTYPLIFLKNKMKILEVYESLADTKSKLEYLNQLNFRLNLDFDSLSEQQECAYFPNDLDLRLSNQLVFVDAGAYNGDTLESLIKINSEINLIKYIGIEPDKNNYIKLCDLIKNQKIVTNSFLFENGLGPFSGRMKFNCSGDMNSSIDIDGDSEITIVTLDEIYTKCINSSDFVYIKFDIEGFEAPVINSSIDLIKNKKPTLAVSIYHKFDDFWNIPLSILNLNVGYSLYMRNHGIDATDFIFYAIPEKM
jgi:FkbM family methyltransferase